MSKSTSESRLLEIQNELNLLLQQDQEALEPVDLIARSCPIISRFFNAERTTFFVYDEKEGRLQSIYAEGPTPLKIILSLGEGLVGACFSSLKSSYTNTPYSKQDFQKKYDRRTGFKTHSSLVTPLYMGERPFGVLQVLNREDGFNGDNLKEVESVAKTLTSHLNFYQFIRGGAAARSELESLLQTIPEVLYRLDQDGNFGFLSQEVLKWGYFREELMGQHFSIILHPEDAPRVSRESVLPLYAGKITGQQGAPGLFDERRSGKRGSKRLRIRILPGPHINYEELFPGVREEEDKAFFVEVNASGFWEKDPSGQAYFAGTMGIITDVTERHFAEQRLKATQQELIQAERFAGLGTLSAGIAHDFNNILAAIGLSADVSRALLKEGQVGDQLDDTIKTIAEYVKKAADLTSRLLALGRSNISKVESSNISDIIQDATGVILNQLENKGITLQKTIAPGIPPCLFDRGQLRDVLINLITNSMHSIDERERRGDSGENPRLIQISARQSSGEIILEIKDNGMGIEPKILPRIFDPFFSTKIRDSRKGTGLGLSMVFSIVQNHGGRIQIDSLTQTQLRRKRSAKNKEVGTTFTIHLPMRESSAVEPVAESRKSLPPIPQNALIYVVDDEPAILDLMLLVLRSAGYSDVKTFSNGSEALEELEIEDPPPQIIITDVVMPPLDGLGLCKEAKKLSVQPPPIFVVTSGKLSEEVQVSFQELGVSHFLKKPCTREEIVATLFKALQEHQAAQPAQN